MDKSIEIDVIIDTLRSKIINLGKYIYMHPELAYNEVLSSQACVELLSENDFKIEKGIGGIETSFRATYKCGNGGKNIAYIAEFDALPQIGHACGHNLIACCGVGSGIALSKLCSNLNCTVTVMGTPAEEKGGGKITLVDNGAFNGIDYSLMAHPDSINRVLRPGRYSKEICVDFYGKEAHSSAPEKGINALKAMIMLFNLIDILRSEFPINTNVDGIIRDGGKVANIIPGFASATFSIRANNSDDGKLVEEKIKKVINGVELITGARAQCTYKKAYAERHGNPTIELLFKKYMEEQDEIVEVASQVGKYGSSDMGNVCKIMPASHSYFKIGDNIICHTKEFAKAANSEKAYEMTLKTIKALTLSGYTILTDKNVSEKIKYQFDNNVLV